MGEIEAFCLLITCTIKTKNKAHNSTFGGLGLLRAVDAVIGLALAWVYSG